MGSWAHVIVEGGDRQGCEWARGRIADLERRWSRFLPDSEISRMNRGRRTVVSAETAGLIERALVAQQETAGRFDPMVLSAVVDAGYDRTYGVAEVPEGSGFDPGGIGKGYAADVVAQELIAAGASGACVNVGGDLRVDGVPPGGPPWVIAVEDPFGGPPLARLGVNRGAVATSSRLKRSWPGGHHVIDPSTGRPAVTDAVAVTVIAAAAWWAEALATAALVAGVAAGLEMISRLGATGLAVDAGGTVLQARGLAPYLDA